MGAESSDDHVEEACADAGGVRGRESAGDGSERIDEVRREPRGEHGREERLRERRACRTGHSRNDVRSAAEGLQARRGACARDEGRACGRRDCVRVRCAGRAHGSRDGTERGERRCAVGGGAREGEEVHERGAEGRVREGGRVARGERGEESDGRAAHGALAAVLEAQHGRAQRAPVRAHERARVPQERAHDEQRAAHGLGARARGVLRGRRVQHLVPLRLPAALALRAQRQARVQRRARCRLQPRVLVAQRDPHHLQKLRHAHVEDHRCPLRQHAQHQHCGQSPVHHCCPC